MPSKEAPVRERTAPYSTTTAPPRPEPASERATLLSATSAARVPLACEVRARPPPDTPAVLVFNSKNAEGGTSK